MKTQLIGAVMADALKHMAADAHVREVEGKAGRGTPGKTTCQFVSSPRKVAPCSLRPNERGRVGESWLGI